MTHHTIVPIWHSFGNHYILNNIPYCAKLNKISTKTKKIEEIRFRFGVVLPVLLAKNRDSSDFYSLFSFDDDEEKTKRINKTTRYIVKLKNEKYLSQYITVLKGTRTWYLNLKSVMKAWKNGMVTLSSGEFFKNKEFNKKIDAISPTVKEHREIIFSLSYLNIYPRFDFESGKLSEEIAKYINSRIIIFLVMCLRTIYYEFKGDERVYDTLQIIYGFYHVLYHFSAIYPPNIINKEDTKTLKKLGIERLTQIIHKLLNYIYSIDSDILKGINVQIGAEKINNNTVNMTYNLIAHLMEDVKSSTKYFFAPIVPHKEYLLLSRINSEFLREEKK